jgi:hypothetical protein
MALQRPDRELAKVFLHHVPVLAFYDLVLDAVRIVRWWVLEVYDQDAEAALLEALGFGGGDDRGPHFIREAVDLVDALALHAAASAFGVEIDLISGIIQGLHLATTVWHEDN